VTTQSTHMVVKANGTTLTSIVPMMILRSKLGLCGLAHLWKLVDKKGAPPSREPVREVDGKFFSSL
jgi:hypothetical protein